MTAKVATRTASASPPQAAGLADRLAKLGIAREEDLALHLPLRYEDHTRVRRIAELRAGETAQAEGVVVRTDIQYRPRRQLVCLIGDDEERATASQLVLRFFSFYPSQQKALAPGNRVRVFGDVREGYYGVEIVHPQFRIVAPGTPVPDRLTPVYPTTAGLSQDTLRKVIARAIAAHPSRTSESLPEDFVRRRQLWKFGDALQFLHAPPPRLVARLLETGAEALSTPGDAILPVELAGDGRLVVLAVEVSAGEYRAGDQVWLRETAPDAVSRLLNRDVLAPRPGGRFAFGRMIDRDGERVALLPPGVGKRQVVIANPPWIAVAEMLVRRL